jgi:hypothetical protein
MVCCLFEFKSWNGNEMKEDGAGVCIGVLERIWLCLAACKESFGFKSIYKWFMYVFRHCDILYLSMRTLRCRYVTLQ